jgi:hypothetical protein
MSQTSTATLPIKVDGHHQILIQGPEPLVIDPTSKRAQRDLSEAEARLLTTEIRRTSVRLWIMVAEAHDRKAHVALGYKTWDDYVRGELDMSPARSYQLLDTGRVMKAMAAAGADIEALETPPARIVARVKDDLPAVRSTTRKAMSAKSQTPLMDALRELAKSPQRQARAAAATSAASTATRPRSDASTGTGQGRGPVSCPACGGEGKVSRSLAPAIRAWLKERSSKKS